MTNRSAQSNRNNRVPQCAESEPPTAESADVDYDRIKRAVREILAAVGENPDREGLLETPSRVARMSLRTLAPSGDALAEAA